VATHNPQPRPKQGRLQEVIKLEGDFRRKLLRFLTNWIALPFLATLISVMILGRAANWVVGPDSYKVYVIGNLSEPESKEIADAFSADRLPQINGTKVDIVELDDSGDPDTAQQISLRISALGDTLLVVGHLESTPTQKALPAYLQLADPPIPVILTTETNPNLLPRNVDGLYQPVFRLSPNDNKQAKKAANFLSARGGARIWVVEDRANPVYSQYLAREFVRQIHALPPKQSEPAARVLLWSTNYSIPPPSAVTDLGINWVFFAGEPQNALVLIRQLTAIRKTHPINILLSDWCVDGSLLANGGKDVENVYLTHPLKVEVYNQGRYTVYGKDSFQLVKQLLSEGDQQFDHFAGQDRKFGYTLRKLLGLRRVSDARRVLALEMQGAVLGNKTFSLSNGGEASFDGTSNRLHATFEVWQIRNGKFDTPISAEETP